MCYSFLYNLQPHSHSLLLLLLQDINTGAVDKSPDFKSDLFAWPQQDKGGNGCYNAELGIRSVTEGKNYTGTGCLPHLRSGFALGTETSLRSGDLQPAGQSTAKHPTSSWV